MALSVAQALHFLHSFRIVHFDVSAGNVLLTRKLDAKLSDAGLARWGLGVWICWRGLCVGCSTLRVPTVLAVGFFEMPKCLLVTVTSGLGWRLHSAVSLKIWVRACLWAAGGCLWH